MDNDSISKYDICAKCTKDFLINELLICNTCNKILCNECKIYLARRTDEVNFDDHYCDDIKHGKLLKLYNKQIMK